MSDNLYSAPKAKVTPSHISPRWHETRPRLWVKLSGALAGFLLGVIASPFIAGAFVAFTYSCKPGPGEPCDAGGYVGMGLTILLAPILGSVFAVLGYWWAARRERRRAA
jgi:hypothetical protein